MAASQHFHIPGEAEAVALERRLRNEIYLNAPRDICGILVRQITPQIHAYLSAVNSPFVSGGAVSDDDIHYFLWICSVDFKADEEARQAFLEKSLLIDLDEAEDAIDEFIRDTYMDSPKGGGKGKPFCSTCAFIEHTMASEPFRWDYDSKTQHVPLRRIFQLMNLNLKDRRLIVNPISDKVTAEFQEQLNSPEAMEERRKEWEKRMGGRN